jgi:hypothetical protein
VARDSETGVSSGLALVNTSAKKYLPLLHVRSGKAGDKKICIPFYPPTESKESV